MSATLDWKSWCELPAVETVDRSQSLARLQQLRKFVGRVFELTKYFFRIFLGLSYYDGNRVVPGSELVMSVRKVTNELLGVEASRKSSSRIWSRKQRHVKAHSIGTIDERSLLRDSDKCFSAVRALRGVSLQRSTPVAGAISTKTVSEIDPKGDKWGVPKTLSPASPQTAETVWCGKAGFGVQQTLVFGIGS